MPWLPMGVMNKWKWKKWKMELRPNTVTQFRRHYLCYLLYLSMHGTTKRFMCVCVCVCVKLWYSSKKSLLATPSSTSSVTQRVVESASASFSWRRRQRGLHCHRCSPLAGSAPVHARFSQSVLCAYNCAHNQGRIFTRVSPREAFSNGGPSYLRILKKSDKTKSILFQV